MKRWQIIKKRDMERSGEGVGRASEVQNAKIQQNKEKTRTRRGDRCEVGNYQGETFARNLSVNHNLLGGLSLSSQLLSFLEKSLYGETKSGRQTMKDKKQPGRVFEKHRRRKETFKIKNRSCGSFSNTSQNYTISNLAYFYSSADSCIYIFVVYLMYFHVFIY